MRQGQAVMSSNYVAAVIAFLGGSVIAVINTLIMAKHVKSESHSLPGITLLRQIINAVYLAAIYFGCRKLSFDSFWPLIGAATGITIPSIFFAITIAKRMKGDD